MQIAAGKLTGLLDQVREGVYFVDRERRVTFWNQGAEEITGFAADEVVGSSCRDNVLIHVDAHGKQMCDTDCPLAATMADGVGRDTYAFMHHRDGHRIQVSVRVSPLRDEQGRIAGGIQIFTDGGAGQLQRQEDQVLRRLMLLDSVTGVSNRDHLERQLEALFLDLVRHRVGFGVMLIDVDRFGEFNRAYGHRIGDRILRTVAGTLRASCGPFDLIGRWRGEQFLGLLRNVGAGALTDLAERMRALVAASSLMVDDKRLAVTVSIGVTSASPEDSIRSILDRVSQLMLQSKAAGRDRVTSDGDA